MTGPYHSMTPEERHGPRSVWHAIGRPIAAYCAASCVAALMLFEPWSWGGYGSLNRPWKLAVLMNEWLVASLVIAAIAALPTFLIAGCIFATRIPRGIGEVFAGALVGPVILLVFGGYVVFLPPDPMIFQIMIAGAAAGAVYWLLVGRPRHARTTDLSGKATN